MVLAESKASLLVISSRLIEQSGGYSTAIGLSAWLGSWLDEPLCELGGQTPAQALRSESGLSKIETLLERMRGGLVG